MPLADREAEEHVLVRFLIISLFEEAMLRFDPEWVPAREPRSWQLKTTGRDTKATSACKGTGGTRAGSFGIAQGTIEQRIER